MDPSSSTLRMANPPLNAEAEITENEVLSELTVTAGHATSGAPVVPVLEPPMSLPFKAKCEPVGEICAVVNEAGTEYVELGDTVPDSDACDGVVVKECVVVWVSAGVVVKECVVVWLSAGVVVKECVVV